MNRQRATALQKGFYVFCPTRTARTQGVRSKYAAGVQTYIKHRHRRRLEYINSSLSQFIVHLCFGLIGTDRFDSLFYTKIKSVCTVYQSVQTLFNLMNHHTLPIATPADEYGKVASDIRALSVLVNEFAACAVLVT